ncbi:methyl-accepting chemotaxis protein [Psychromonas aquimarina]|uniref:methyl-accepting chemotaxis protein n=1 Tax=Psychromonas aquimarina TaxID=444919 RepID=UPI00041496A3|nr:methyl-accepting chemotaxis protein [Psychromonas aquimarina]
MLRSFKLFTQLLLVILPAILLAQFINFQITSSYMEKVLLETDQSELMNGFYQIQGLSSVVTFLLLAALIWLLARHVMRPMHKVISTLNNIAEGDGDLSIRLNEDGKDEIAQLAQALNHVTHKMDKTVHSVNTSTNKLVHNIITQTMLADSTSTGVSSQQQKTEQVAAALNEMSATVNEITQNTSQAADAAAKTNQEALKGKEASYNAVQSIDSLAQEMDQAVASIQRVKDDSQRIGSVLDVIKNIAEQTNLLALNAAIEAARAGESGRGFAVVADEVRTLASRTQASTEEINEMINSLQAAVSSANDTMNNSHAQVQKTVTLVADAGQGLADISFSIGTIDDMNNQIATASEEQAVVTEDINRNVSAITEEAVHTSNNARDSMLESVDISTAIEKMLILISQFKTSNDIELQLMRAKSSHSLWKVKIKSYLNGYLQLDAAVVSNHHKCAFGKWFDSPGVREQFPDECVSEINSRHKLLHQSVGKIIACKEKSEFTQADLEYQQLIAYSDSVVALLDQLITAVQNKNQSPPDDTAADLDEQPETQNKAQYV